jgi:hypothetical protein
MRYTYLVPCIAVAVVGEGQALAPQLRKLHALPPELAGHVRPFDELIGR